MFRLLVYSKFITDKFFFSIRSELFSAAFAFVSNRDLFKAFKLSTIISYQNHTKTTIYTLNILCVSFPESFLQDIFIDFLRVGYALEQNNEHLYLYSQTHIHVDKYLIVVLQTEKKLPSA